MKYRYNDLRPMLGTGDVVLFAGKGRVSRWIRWFCSILNGFKKVKFSHVGMVVRDMDAGGKDRIALFESTSIDGGVKGVRLVPLSEAIQNYDGQVFVRRLILMNGPEFIDGLTKQQVLALHLFIANNLGKPYEKHILELMGAATPWFWGKGNDDDFFCSELVASVYQMLRLLPKQPLAKEYAPDPDFNIGGKVDANLRHSEQPACLGTLIEIVK